MKKIRNKFVDKKMRIAIKKSIECLNDTLNSRNEYLLKPFLLNGMLKKNLCINYNYNYNSDTGSLIH